MAAKVHQTRPPRVLRPNDRDYSGIDDFLDAIKQRYRLETDYQLQKHMEWGTSKLGNWRSGRSLPNDEECHRIADMLGLNGLYVIAVIRELREQNAPIKELWGYLARVAKSWAPLTLAPIAVLAAALERGIVCILWSMT
jgi:hypothetical protein